MKKMIRSCVLVSAVSLASATVAMAEPMADEPAIDESLIQGVFSSVSVDEFELLNAEQMEATEGELWPFILGVATVDLALSSYFWGVYVPTVSGTGGLCVGCYYPAP